jgi:hypothetical protein
MICPHCKKPFKNGPTPEALRIARELKEQGYTLRDIEMILFTKGIVVSSASLFKALSKDKKRGSHADKKDSK